MLVRDEWGGVRFEDNNRPELTVEEVLAEHHVLDWKWCVPECYCGHRELRREAFGRSLDGLDLHRAEVLMKAFRIEDA